MKKLNNEATDSHQPSGPYPIDKEVEKLLENWFSLSGDDKKQIIQQILRRILHTRIISDVYNPGPATMDFYTDVGYLFWEADIKGSYRAVFDDDTVKILRLDLLNFLEFAANHGAVSYRRDNTGYFWQILDWEIYDACCQKFHFNAEEFEDNFDRLETQQKLTQCLLDTYYPGKVY